MFFREDLVGSKAAGMKIISFSHFLPNLGPAQKGSNIDIDK